MLVIRQKQRDALRAKREEECVDRLEEHLRDTFPREASQLGSNTMKEVIRFGMQRCASHGHKTEREMFVFLALAFMLGSYFDEDPQLLWANARFRSAEPSLIDLLHEDALAYLDRVAGEENEHLIRALLRVRSHDLATVREIPAALFEDHMVRLLGDIYPTKYREQGEDATRTVVRLGVQLSAKYGMEGNEGACLLAGLAFFLGFGFDRDLQHPWVRACLNMNASASFKVKELHRRSSEFAGLGLG